MKRGRWRAKLGGWAAAAALAAPLSVQPVAAADTPAPAVDREWTKLLTDLEAAGRRVDGAVPPGFTDQDQAENTLVKLGTLMSGYLTVANSDPDYPRFVPSLGLYENFLGPNPDTVYMATALNGKGVYRIKGTRGGAPIVNFGLLHGPYLGLTGKAVPHTDYDIDDLHFGPGGAFEVILSAERPAGYAGDWWKLDPATTRMTLRVVSDDWGKQEDPRFSIQRLDIPSRRSRPSAEDIRGRLPLLADYVFWTNTLFSRRLSGFVEKGQVNKVVEIPIVELGGLTGQRYFHTPLMIEDGEAVVLESEVPKTCKYWSILTTDFVDSSLDWVNNQTSLNRNQARLDSDGKLRVVFANADPGVPNWIDLAGRKRAGMQLRWASCDSAPVPTVRKVSLSEVRKYLPKDTPIMSPSQREESLRARRDGAQLRRQW